jgi:hypothetical protein
MWGVRKTINKFSPKHSASWTKVGSESSWVFQPHCFFQLLPYLYFCNLNLHYVITSQFASGQQAGPPVPCKEVWVENGKRFRLRLVGGICSVCGVQFSIEGHDLTLIATDGKSVNNVTVGSVDIFSGTIHEGWRYFGESKLCRSLYVCEEADCLQFLFHKTTLNMGHNWLLWATVSYLC